MKKFDPKNPWAVDVCGTPCVTCGVADRLRKVKQCESIDELSAMIVWNGTEKTVRGAAAARIRGLYRKMTPAEKDALFNPNAKGAKS